MEQGHLVGCADRIDWRWVVMSYWYIGPKYKLGPLHAKPCHIQILASETPSTCFVPLPCTPSIGERIDIDAFVGVGCGSRMRNPALPVRSSFDERFREQCILPGTFGNLEVASFKTSSQGSRPQGLEPRGFKQRSLRASFGMLAGPSTSAGNPARC
jgi:hypothetical protein